MDLNELNTNTSANNSNINTDKIDISSATRATVCWRASDKRPLLDTKIVVLTESHGYMFVIGTYKELCNGDVKYLTLKPTHIQVGPGVLNMHLHWSDVLRWVPWDEVINTEYAINQLHQFAEIADNNNSDHDTNLTPADFDNE
jgi:hypothetical protein